MPTLADDLAKMEYDRLSKEIISIQEEANQLARYAVVAAATICAVVATKKGLSPSYLPILKMLPFGITLLFGFRVYAQYGRLMNISYYMQSRFEGRILKRKFGHLGWETHLNKVVRARKKDAQEVKDAQEEQDAQDQKSFLRNPQGSVLTFWIVLLCLSFTFILL